MGIKHQMHDTLEGASPNRVGLLYTGRAPSINTRPNIIVQRSVRPRPAFTRMIVFLGCDSINEDIGNTPGL